MTKATTLAQLDQLDQELSRLFRQLERYDNAPLNQQPTDGGWTVLQVLHHLILAEEASVGYIQKKLSFNPVLEKAGFRAAWRLFVVDFYFRMPLKFKAPKGVDREALPEHADFESTKAQWESQRRALRKYLSHLPDAQFDRELYKHPFAGKMSLRQMLQFFGMHIKRHQSQINRVLKEVG
ncbi:MAG: DinB family protein [Phaeodactylibacter sp.]|uniref:DinB family protein n=1 Tax=Phaeodactylibacter sp. TaxID=1940289 RepID=UPI0032EEAE0A